MTNRTTLYIILAMLVMLSSLTVLTSCKDDKEETYSYSTSEMTTLVKGFALQNDASVLENLDSVHFTIDYDKGLIYNADSLPVGTEITKLKVIMEFVNTVKSAVFNISDAEVQADTAINYTTSMSQTIDFTGKTVLTVTSADGSEVKNYEVKVLVHQVEPNMLLWVQNWRRDLPGMSDGLQHFKAVEQDGMMRALTWDGNQCMLLTADAANQTSWSKQALSLPFTPNVKTFTATDLDLYMLDMDGNLYTSTDGKEWTSCGVKWFSLLGAYQDRVLGIVSDDAGNYVHDEYPRSVGFTSKEVEEDFPVKNSSNMIEVQNTWSVAPQAMIVGGINSEGKMIKDTWGYDGQTWGKINNVHSEVLPDMADATLFSYYTFKKLTGVRRYARQSTWYLMGGRKSDGSLNNDIYLSNTQGITWFKGDTTMVQAGFMPKFYGAQAFVCEETLQAPQHAPSYIKGAVTSWPCPFLYLYGGYGEDNALLPNVWRGVYNRLTNVPVY